MNRSIIASLAVASCMVWSLVARAETEKKKDESSSPAFAKFADLAGEWVGKGTHGDAEHESRIVYKVTSGGSAVVETLDPDGDHEMITVIHKDGDSLLLTHYCMLGNQPQMRAKPKAGDKKVAFEFVKATNLNSDKDMYMRSVTYTFVDKDTLEAEWTHYDDGKEAGKAILKLKRKK